MLWIGKHPPIYVWEEDRWHNERNGQVYWPSYDSECWIHNLDRVPFQKKTVKMDRQYGKAKSCCR